jgi:hypothetical protein
MKKIRLFLSVLFVVAVLNSCSDRKNFVTGNMKTIHFDKEYIVAGEHLNVDSIGIYKVEILDQYLILGIYSQECFVKIYDLRSLNFIGDFFCKGQGPEDFVYAFIEHVKSPYIRIEDRPCGLIKIINILETVADMNRQLSIKNTINYLGAFSANQLRSLYVNDTLLWIKTYDRYKEKMLYHKYNPAKQKIIDEMEIYNYPVPVSIQNEMAIFADCIKPDGSKIVSTTAILDQLDIFNLAYPDKSISVTEKKYLLDYEYIKIQKNENLKTFYFSFPRCTENLIYALYRNHENHTVELHIIDWNGNPICKLLPDRKLKDCTIDFDNGFMYGISDVEERIYRYDIRNILKTIIH